MQIIIAIIVPAVLGFGWIAWKYWTDWRPKMSRAEIEEERNELSIW